MESSAYVPVVLDIADDSEPLLKTVSEAVDVKEINIENLNEGGTGVDSILDFSKNEKIMSTVDCLLLHDSNDFHLLDYTIACVNHYENLLNESNLTEEIVLSYANDITINEGFGSYLLLDYHRAYSLT